MGKPVKRQRLSRELIVDKALELIESEGLENLSTRSLGRALGVQAMALYHHVPSKDDLLDAVTARLATMMKLPESSSDWRAELESTARSYIDIARRHPRAFPLLAMRRYNTPETLPVLERLFSNLKQAGLDPKGVATAFRIVGYFLNGAGLAEVATIESTRRAGFQLPDPAFLKDFPRASETVPLLAAPYLDGIFETGLSAILDWVEAEGAKSRSGAG